MEISLKNLYVDLGALKVNELNEGVISFVVCSRFFSLTYNDRPMLSKCKCIGNSYHVLLSRSAMSS